MGSGPSGEPPEEQPASGLPSSPSPSPPPSSVEAVTDQMGNLSLGERNQEEDDADREIAPLPTQESASSSKESLSSSKEGKVSAASQQQHPVRPDQLDCVFYVKTGSCKFGMSCKFNHPPRKARTKVKSKKQSQLVQASNEKQMETSPKYSEQMESKASNEKQTETSPKCSEQTESKDVEVNEKGTLSGVRQTEHKKAIKEKRRETFSGGTGTIECKYYSTPGGCKYGKACRYAHTREKAEVVPVDLNFLGLPMRPGEKECPYYMRTGGCKFASNCRFHHPDPTAVGGQVPLSGYPNGGSPVEHSLTTQLPVASWPLQGTSNEPIPFLDASTSYVPGIFLHPQGIHPNPEWNGYQAPVNQMFPPEMNLQPPLSAPAFNANGSILQQDQINEYSERPGQPECQFFMKTGTCKFKSACRFHHPRSRIPKTSGDVLSPMGLPLKPGQPVCTHYTRYRICKYGRACKYDHPMDISGSGAAAAGVAPNQAKYPESSSGKQEVRMGESSDAPVQESEW